MTYLLEKGSEETVDIRCVSGGSRPLRLQGIRFVKGHQGQTEGQKRPWPLWLLVKFLPFSEL